MKKITENQIVELFAFTRTHFVEWYDLQVELVDHLANDIEQEWIENPNLSFEEAKQIAFKKFGVFGFGGVIESRLKSLNKKYYKMMLQSFLTFFKVPKILLLMSALGVVFWFLQKTSINESMFFVFLLVYISFVGYRLVLIKRGVNARLKSTDKKYLTDQILSNFAHVGFVFWYPLIINFDWGSIQQYSAVQSAFIALWIVMMSLYIWIGLVKIPNEIDAYMSDLYPEYASV